MGELANQNIDKHQILEKLKNVFVKREGK